VEPGSAETVLVGMDKATYLKKAEECAGLATDATYDSDRAAFVQLAEAYMRLAQSAEHSAEPLSTRRLCRQGGSDTSH
jgi:hypothetical protein